MATFAEYPAQTMASNDFTLYPYSEVWNPEQAYLPPTSYADQSYINAATFDSYDAQQAYVQPEGFPFALEPSFQPKNIQALNSNYSPANSASHSFDPQNPPVLSAPSESGASVQSTISSAIGSPSVQPQHSNDWLHQQGFLPGIVQPEMLGHDVFATTGFDFETIPVTDKGCVGELSTISSSQLLQIPRPFKFSSYSSLDLLRDTETNALPSGEHDWLLPSNTPTPPYDTLSLPLQSSLLPRTDDSSVESASPNDSVFKSPSTPASATSPVLERVRGKRNASVTPPAPKRARGSSPLTQATSYHESDLPVRPQAPPPTLNSPFFSQSSGHFVPPLDYSCPSPLVFLLSFERS